MLQQQLERLVEHGIELLPTTEITTHFVFVRDGFVALVERKPDGFGAIGAPGLLVEAGGFAALVWRGAEAWFVSKVFEQQATAEQIADIRRFSDDLNEALRAGS